MYWIIRRGHSNHARGHLGTTFGALFVNFFCFSLSGIINHPTSPGSFTINDIFAYIFTYLWAIVMNCQEHMMRYHRQSRQQMNHALLASSLRFWRKPLLDFSFFASWKHSNGITLWRNEFPSIKRRQSTCGLHNINSDIHWALWRWVVKPQVIYHLTRQQKLFDLHDAQCTEIKFVFDFL